MRIPPIKKIYLLVGAALYLGAMTASAEFSHFISRDGHRLLNGDQEFRFAGIHAPELHRIENDAAGACSQDPRGWGQYFQWPTADEQENWIKALVRTGHKAMRIYVLSVATPYDEACKRETHILPPTTPNGMPRLNENAMVVYDRMIALAEKHHLRLILPFIDHWKWWGGREQLAAFYHETAEDFYDTHSKTYQAYLHIIRTVINRKNTITGRLYSQEKAIMAWETGNELRHSTTAFVQQTAAVIKHNAPQQLVIDGTYLKILPSSLEDPNIDIISNHFYTTNNNNNPAQIEQDLKTINGKKVYLIGEYGLKDAAGLDAIMQKAVHYDYNGARAAGAFIWGLRGHRHNGGFYWHKEYTGHYSYHLPGFAEGDSNEELKVVNLVRKAQAQLEGRNAAAPLPIPEPPKLRSITKNGAVAWMGSPVGQHYRIERSLKNPLWQVWQPWGPWVTIGSHISDGKQAFNPKVDTLFVDTLIAQNPLSRAVYRYRIFAANASGESPASNIIKTQ